MLEVRLDAETGQLVEHVGRTGPVLEPLEVFMETAARVPPALVDHDPPASMGERDRRCQTGQSGARDFDRLIRSGCRILRFIFHSAAHNTRAVAPAAMLLPQPVRSSGAVPSGAAFAEL